MRHLPQFTVEYENIALRVQLDTGRACYVGKLHRHPCLNLRFAQLKGNKPPVAGIGDDDFLIVAGYAFGSA